MMNYKGMQLPLTHCNLDTGDLTQKLHTIESVTFDPCIVTFKNGVVLDWKYTKEEFDNYIENLEYPMSKEPWYSQKTKEFNKLIEEEVDRVIKETLESDLDNSKS